MAGRHRRVRPVTGHGRHRKPPRRGHVVLPTLAVAAVLGVGGVSAGAALGGGGGGANRGPVLHPVVAPAHARSAPAQSTTPVAAAPAGSAVARGASVPDFAITVTGHVCWVQVVAPRGRVLFAGLLRHGRTLTYPQRPLQVTLGDAGAVRLVLHHHAKPAGRRGQVLRFLYR